jgi:chromate transport protein ChrA
MRLSLWAWLFWSLPIYLVLEVGPFLIVGWGHKKTVGELVGPYLAFAVPAVIMMPLVWWLRMSEELGTSPKRLARRWVLSAAMFFVAVIVAVFYSGVEFRLIDPKDALGGFVAAVLLSVPSYFITYRMMLRVISTRMARETGRCLSQDSL